MRIFIVEPDGTGGLLHFAHQLAQAMTDEGAEVTLITSEDYELADLPRGFRVLPVMRLWRRVEPPGRPSAQGPRRAVRRVWRGVVLTREWIRISRILLRERPDFTLFSIIRFPIVSLALKQLRRCGLALGQICHEFETRELADGWLRRQTLALNATGYQAFQAIFFLARSTRDDFVGLLDVDRDRTHVVPHGPELLFDVTAETRQAASTRYRAYGGERIVLLFGGLRPSKGTPELIEAFARLSDRPDVRLVIAGYPSKEFDTNEVRRQVHERGLDERVTMDFRYVPVEELGPLVAIADVVVFPYRTATASGALALAQSLGRPVVATDVGGLSEDVEHAVTGLIVPQGDVDALAAAIGALLDDPAGAARMGEAGRTAIIRDRSWPAIARRILAVARDSLEARGDPA